MTVASIRKALTTSLADRKISKTEVKSLFSEATKGDTKITAAERAELKKILTTHGSKFSPAAKTEFQRLFAAATGPAAPGSPQLQKALRDFDKHVTKVQSRMTEELRFEDSIKASKVVGSGLQVTVSRGDINPSFTPAMLALEIQQMLTRIGHPGVHVSVVLR